MIIRFSRLAHLDFTFDIRNSSYGFTLIELLVTVAISLVLIGLGVVGFLDFNERQKIISTARELETIFQTAQVKAQAGDLGGCTELTEYRVSFDTTVDPVTVTLTPACAGGTTGTTKVYELTSGITLSLVPSATSLIHFRVLQRGIIFTPSTANLQLTLSSTTVNKSYSFTLAQGGDISDGTWQ